MTESGRSLPKDVIENWPEIFGEVTLNVLPFKYLDSVMVNFKDGRTWEIKISSKTKRGGWPTFEKSLSELCKTYEDTIADVDFKLDTIRVKKDIKKSTDKFLKKTKL